MAKAIKGFDVHCPYCQDADGIISVSVHDLTLTCGACDKEFSAEDAVALARERYERWQSVARWIGAAPGFAAPQ